MQDVLVVDFNGTAPTYTYYFTKGLLDGNLSVEILGKENQEYLKIHPQKLHYKGVDGFPKTINYLINWLLLLLMAKRYKAIHFQWLPLLNKTSLELYLLKALQGINPNVFYTVHNFYPHDSNDPKVQKRYLKLYKMVNKLVVHTNKTAGQIFDFTSRNDVIVINHGYFYKEISDYQKVDEKEELVSMLGFIRPYKGAEDAIKAIAQMKENNSRIKLLIAGKCNERYYKNLIEQVELLGVSEQVSIQIGFLSTRDLIHAYRKSKVCLLPYKRIDQSGVLMTSLGLSVPIVAYDKGGFGDVIKNGWNGYLVEQDNIPGLVDGIEKCLQNNDRMKMNILSDQKKDLWLANAHKLKKAYLECSKH